MQFLLISEGFCSAARAKSQNLVFPDQKLRLLRLFKGSDRRLCWKEALEGSF